jgi:hypothetical protein
VFSYACNNADSQIIDPWQKANPKRQKMQVSLQLLQGM